MTRTYYFDTSVWSRLVDPPRSAKRRLTEGFVGAVQSRDRIVVSLAVFAELAQTPGGKKAEELARRVWATRPMLLPSMPEARRMALALLAAGRWRENRFADMLHVAYTLCAGADALVT